MHPQLLKSCTAALMLWLPLGQAAVQGRPESTTICDYYTEKTIGETTPANQRLLMTLVLHSALLGPYSEYNTVPVDDFTGALKPREFLGNFVDLNGYFNAGFKSSNTGGEKGQAVNFLDDGGLDAARKSKPGNGNTKSMQYLFFSHVYSYFGTFLGCSHLGSKELPQYAGKASMYEVHKFMYLSNSEMSYFIDQAVRGLVSFGFDDADAQFVNMTLISKFNKRCAAAEPIIPPSAGPQLQPICTAPDCVLAPNNTCSAYEEIGVPEVADAALIGNYTKDADGHTSLQTQSVHSPTPGPSNDGVGSVGIMLSYLLVVLGFSILNTLL